jgi:hypothetical protein
MKSRRRVNSTVGRLQIGMVTRIVRFIIASVALSCCGLVYSQTKPSAREVLHAMVAQYSAVSSYQDSGTVMLVQADPDIVNRLLPPSSANDKTLVSFRTYFVRSSTFRFDWKSSALDWRSLPATRSREASIWSDGKNVYQWMPNPSADDDGFIFSDRDYLPSTIDEAGKSSASAVYPLISLFIKEANIATSFADLLEMATEQVLVKEELVDGETCYVVKANLSGAPWTFWVAKQRHILRKTRTVYSYGSFDERVETGVRHEFVAEETRRNIKINEPISKGIFKYRPRLRPYDLDSTHYGKRRPTNRWTRAAGAYFVR